MCRIIREYDSDLTQEILGEYETEKAMNQDWQRIIDEINNEIYMVFGDDREDEYCFTYNDEQIRYEDDFEQYTIFKAGV